MTSLVIGADSGIGSAIVRILFQGAFTSIKNQMSKATYTFKTLMKHWHQHCHRMMITSYHKIAKKYQHVLGI